MSGGICAIAGIELALDVGVAPALDAFDDDHAPADGERHRGERVGDGCRRRALAVEQLDVRDAAVGFGPLGERAQPGAALGDGAVVVAVDQVRGLELGHRG